MMEKVPKKMTVSVSFSCAVFSLFDCLALGLALLGLVQSDLVGHFICEFKCQLQQKNLVLHSSKYCNIIQVYLNPSNRMPLV
jgi:hypothetical protein